MTALHPLCPEDALRPGEALGFDSGDPATPGLFAVRDADGAVLIYRNACPHLRVPLDWAPGRFLDSTGTRIVCANHGAEFRLGDGLCMRGPCKGQSLERVRAAVLNGMIMAEGPPAG